MVFIVQNKYKNTIVSVLRTKIPSLRTHHLCATLHSALR